MLGVCYYPEHWSTEQVQKDIHLMRELGIHFVRMGEFAWSRIEPKPGQFEWRWLDEVLELVDHAGMKAVLGTPTATPPKWLIDRNPDILPVDKEGRRRKFGSRRHYCFSSPAYREEVRRIVEEMAKRYGEHQALAGWQTDNEYGCHDTARCYCPRCQEAFQEWLKEHYGTVETLNTAWGAVFWSQEYGSFEEVELPNLTSADPNPSHYLDYYRFVSDQVRNFNRIQTNILRELSPGRFVTHNFMAFFTDFDHFALGEDLDFATWDSYPLGHTEVFLAQPELTRRYAGTGHPDIPAFHHDLYRSIGRGRFWVMEQQPGPVNWAPSNVSPAPGMIRLWTWETLAHGGEVVSYFRWRQAPFAQEQMHTGLFRPDFSPDVGFYEAKQVAGELKAVELPHTQRAHVALIVDYEAAWVYEIQPHGKGVSYAGLVFHFYTVLRQLGFDIDILSAGTSLEGYELVIVPSLPIIHKKALESFTDFKGIIVFGPRTGSKTENFHIPQELPPGPLQALFPLKIVRVESLGLENTDTVVWQEKEYPVGIWKEWIETDIQPEVEWTDGRGAGFHKDSIYYLAFWPNDEFLLDFFAQLTSEAGLKPLRLPAGLRVRVRGDLAFAFNFSDVVHKTPAPPGVHFLIGTTELKPYDVAVWKGTIQ